MKMRPLIAVLWGAWLVFLGPRVFPAAAAEVGAPEDVAPKVESTRQQRWPRAAWCEGAKCWLVVWREGDYCEQETDIWCARVGADGKALDPEGIRLTSAKGVQDRPVVASDGKGFLVAWSDFRNGKDPSTDSTGSPQAGSLLREDATAGTAGQGWDVYAARVSGDPAKAGQAAALDADGFLVAGGPHNQCYPTVTFAGGNYLVVWQAWVEDVIESRGAQKKFGSYGLRGARVSPDGKPLDGEGKLLADATAVEPSLASDGAGAVQLVWFGRADRRISGAGGLANRPAAARLDAAKLEILGKADYLATDKDSVNSMKQNQVPGLALLPHKGAMLCVRGYKGGTTIFRTDENARKTGECVKMHTYAHDEIDAFASLAAGGDRVLFTQDWPSTPARKSPVRLGVWGWILSPDGKVLEGDKDGFAIAADSAKDRVQGFASSGPAGVFLVVYAEARGPDDTKVVAKLVR